MEYGTGKYLYKLIDGWAPKELSSIDVSGLYIDHQDKVYVLNEAPAPFWFLTAREIS